MFEDVDGGLRLGIDNHSREVVVHLLRELRDEVAATKMLRTTICRRT